MVHQLSQFIEKQRYYYLDLMRGLAIFFMIMQHAMIIHEINEGEGDTIVGNIFVLLGTAPAAPVFLFILGVFVAKSKKTCAEHALRGIKLFFLGYLLNVLRFCLPVLIAGEPYLVGDSPLELFFLVDIFQVAGLSLVIIGLIKNSMRNRAIIPILIVLILLVSPGMWGAFQNTLYLSPFTGTGKNVIFPFFPWIIFPLFGIWLSPHLHRRIRGKKQIVYIGIISAVISLLTLNVFSESDYSRLDPGTALLIISFLCFWILICDSAVYFLFKRKVTIIANTLFFWSRNVTSIFVIQWIIYGWSTLLFGTNAQNSVASMLIGFAVLTMTHLLVRYAPVKRHIFLGIG